MIFHGYEVIGEWENSNCGKKAIGKKNGKRYFLKRYLTTVAPEKNGALDAKTFAHNKKLFDDFVSTRKKINETIRPLSGSGGNIIIPCDEFIDGNNYCEVAELVEGAVADCEVEGILASLSVDVKKLLMKTAAAALQTVHGLHIVHSDLKLKNVLLAMNKSGNYVAKLIDFDSSYFTFDKPEDITGDIVFFSPELALYSNSEEDRDELREKLTEKSDIFSLGLIFHYYLAGELPKPASLTERLRKRQEKGKVIYCWAVLNSGCELEISSRVDNPNYASLIRDMLSLDPNDRPTATEVLKRLDESAPVIEEPWPDHGLIIDRGKLNADGVVGLKKLKVSDQKKYEVLYGNGKKSTLAREDLLSKNYAKVVTPGGFCEPWAEHNIEFDLDKIKSRGFVSGEQKTLAGVKGYSFYRPDSTASFFRADMLVAMKYAKRKTAPTVSAFSECDSPWPEHNIKFDVDVIKSKGYIKVERQTMGSIRGYKFIKADGTGQFIRAEMVLIQKMAKKL